jgi:hypothetical protein
MRIKTLDGRGGTTSNAIDFTTQYSNSTITIHDTTLVPTLSDVTVSNVTGTERSPTTASRVR